MRTPVRLGRRGTTVVLPLLLLAGCGGGDPGETTSPTPGDPPTASRTTQPPEAPDSPTSQPTEPPTSGPTGSDATEPTPEPTGEPEPSEPTPLPTGRKAKLIAPSDLPAPGDVTWRSSSVRRGTGPGDISVCQPQGVTLRAIGATQGVHALHRSGTVSARQVVAEFADERSATLGYAVLEAWLGQCEQHAGARGFESVTAPREYTPLGAGDAAGWALSWYGPVPDDPDSSYIETQALVRVDDTLSWVVWEQIGQDYNYEPGQAPPERAGPLMADALAGRGGT